MESITPPLRGGFPVVYPGTTLLPSLLDLPSARGELAALGGHCCARAVTTCNASCKNPDTALVSALSQPPQPGCPLHAPTESAARLQEPHELAHSSAGSAAPQEQLWLRGSLGTLGW